MTMTQEARPHTVVLFTTVLTASPTHCSPRCQFMGSGECVLPPLPGEDPAPVPLGRKAGGLLRAARCLALTGKR